MSDISITSGGVVDVDTASLRTVAARLRAVAQRCHDESRRLDAVLTDVVEAGAPAASLSWDVGMLRTGVERASDDAESLAAAMERTADLYETVELLAERSAADAADVAGIDARLHALQSASPWLLDEAARALRSRTDRGDLWWQTSAAGLVAGAGLLAPALLGTAVTLVDALRLGAVRRNERLSGPVEPVSLRASATTQAAPVASLADAASRIPHGGDARVRVEKYAMPTGAAQFVVYIAGTQGRTGDAFDMRSNAQLYTGRRSASYEATLAALESAGARPGDAVHAVGFSQGAMIGERLALEGPYETRSVTSFGAPVQAEVGSGTLSVAVRHTDDPVAALASGGLAAQAGAEGSFVVERSADPLPGLQDAEAPAHRLTAYTETAAMVDASADPRVGTLRELFAGLGEADRVTATDYTATRVEAG